MGFICTVGAYVLMATYSPSLDAVDVPAWANVTIAVLTFAYQTLDAMDGKQARERLSPLALCPPAHTRCMSRADACPVTLSSLMQRLAAVTCAARNVACFSPCVWMFAGGAGAPHRHLVAARAAVRPRL